ncbi:glycoside hydrolase family 28 protein [Paraburkholderia sp. SEWSISQ10-3 4]|uniref:glycoside hydrolase family 28 protein n=1 Tax=Paraburkholderia TaxID=1822464 RepID=UPI00225B758B|nr:MULTISPECIES: glycoside hydrolase family 28 protein [Paraburkholderia]MCX4143065.1 glycoside hydrolase family 28 protein [Paraburkholderia aspalathi]MDN7175739.1 glycoside hydrolase family 28 protein [Paraburkholderia sp. SEWSISQ10-3 4]MDQ6505380.1 glycoside hydrolase family 28 protein [Paraburkholderia aspalathi]
MASKDKNNGKPATSRIRSQDEPNSPKRRAFIVLAGTSAGATLLGGLSACGGSSGSLSATTPVSTTPTAAADPIWGPTGQATAIINKLAGITTSTFPAVDFQVTGYGARTLPASALIQASAWPGGAISWVTGAQAATSPQSPGSNVMVPWDMTDTAYDSCSAFNAAIQAAHAVGGGRVVVSAGNWYCGGPIVLLSNVNFHLSSGCTIYFSPNPADYAKNGPYPTANGNLYWTRWQANDCLNFGSPIYAYQQNNIALTAADNTCVLNGQAMTPMQLSTKPPTSCWWTFKGTSSAYGYVKPASGGTPVSQADANTGTTSYPGNAGTYPASTALTSLPAAQVTNPQANVSFTNQDGTTTTLMNLLTVSGWNQDQNYLPALSELGVPVVNRVFGLGHFLRPCMVEFIGCTNVLLQNYHTQNTPFWQHHPTDCTNVVIDGVFADSIGPNNDGFDPDACNNVLVQNVQFNTGDDCIAIKSGKCLDTEYGPMQNIVVQNCTMQSGHGGLTIGSEMSAGVENVYARNLTMQNENWATNPLNIALRFKTNMNRGGFINNVWINGVTLPNGVNLAGKYGGGALGSSVPSSVPGTGTVGLAANPSTGQGGLITFDCDYSPSGDSVRWNPATINNVNITNVNATNVSGTVSYAMPTGFSATSASCFQAIVAQGPVAADYNGPLPVPTVQPITGVTISNCNLGTPICVGPATTTTPGPVFVSNVKSITLSNVVIGGVTYNSSLVG